MSTARNPVARAGRVICAAVGAITKSFIVVARRATISAAGCTTASALMRGCPGPSQICSVPIEVAPLRRAMISTTHIAVVGGGPAGAVVALRLTQLGHDVVLIAGMSSPRSHRGETLTPGVAEQLAFLHLGDALDGALMRRTTDLELRWESDRFEPNTNVKHGLLVERSAFDAGLITAVKRHGVNILSAEVRRAER